MNDLKHISKMKTKRNLSGIYFRYQNPETGRWENWVFEDLPEEKQMEYMNSHSEEGVKRLCIGLANTINSLSEQFDITANPQHKE